MTYHYLDPDWFETTVENLDFSTQAMIQQDMDRAISGPTQEVTLLLSCQLANHRVT